jgi:hypothetical protein
MNDYTMLIWVDRIHHNWPGLWECFTELDTLRDNIEELNGIFERSPHNRFDTSEMDAIDDFIHNYIGFGPAGCVNVLIQGFDIDPVSVMQRFFPTKQSATEQ